MKVLEQGNVQVDGFDASVDNKALVDNEVVRRAVEKVRSQSVGHGEQMSGYHKTTFEKTSYSKGPLW